MAPLLARSLMSLAASSGRLPRTRLHFTPLPVRTPMDNASMLDSEARDYHGVFWRELLEDITHQPITRLRLSYPELVFAYIESKGAPKGAVAKRHVARKTWLVARWRTSR